MNKADALSVGEAMHTRDGLFWPVPVLCLTDSAKAIAVDETVALRDPNIPGHPVLAVLEIAAVEIFSEDEITRLCGQIYGTTDAKHPGAAAFLSQGRTALSGDLKVLNFSYFADEFAATFQTAMQIRGAIKTHGWQKVVAFQTRNPMHRAHEELCLSAMQQIGADGCVIHQLLGKLKPGDIPAAVRDRAIRAMVENYFPPNTALVSGYGFDMLYAGPREAVLHAVFRQNMGATHFIIGRDHAGVGDYYGAFDSQTIFDNEVPAGALDIQIFRADHTAYSKKLGRVAMLRDAPDHKPEDFITISGTQMRAMLSAGKAPPPEITRPEVAEILMAYYQNSPTDGN